jgi:hypothetical protein
LLSDRYASRGIVISLVSVLAVAGFALFLSKVALLDPDDFFPDVVWQLGAEHIFTSYSALYLMASGVFGGGPILGAWLANNSEPHYRRATSVALYLLVGNAVCFGDKYNIVLTHFLFFRVEF